MFRRLFAAISNSVPVTLRQVHCFDRSWFRFPFPSPPSMGFLATLISVAAILWCLLLSSCVTSADSDICYQGYTGPDSGGSCTFNSFGFCNYQRTYNGAQWEVNYNREAFIDMYGKDEGDRAVLTSPLMCGDNITTICIQFNFMFNRRVGGRLTLKLCHVTTGCHDVWFANSEDKDEWKYQQASESIPLTKKEQFWIQFEGEKTYDYQIYRETNFYLDNIFYNNTSCFTDSASAPPPTSDDLLSTLGETTTGMSTDLPTATPPVTHSPDTWKYQCEINENVTDILWILQSTNETETLSRCSVESESCDHRLEDLARATINSTSSFLYISDSFVGQKDGRVGYAEIINGLRGEIRFDARTNPMNRANDPSTETTEQTDASTDSPAATDSLAAWQYQCQIRENVTDVLWILQVGNETETLSRCYIGSESCDQRLDDCAIATINITSSLFNISANLEKVKAGRVGYAEMINGLNGEIRFDAKRNPIKWPCGPLTVTTGIFPSTKQTSESTDYSTGRTSP